MTIEEFNRIEDIQRRAEYLWEHGCFICDKVEYGVAIKKLYALEQFYVEVQWNIHEDMINGITALGLEKASEYVSKRDLAYALE